MKKKSSYILPFFPFHSFERTEMVARERLQRTGDLRLLIEWKKEKRYSEGEDSFYIFIKIYYSMNNKIIRDYI